MIQNKVPGKGYSKRQRKLAVAPFVVIALLATAMYISHNYFDYSPWSSDEAERISVPE